jgi:choline dehydrogenase-like flavoprotein
MGPYDFKGWSRDGLGVDWPIGYDELAPYYDKVESLIGVFGSNEGLENTPSSSPGVLQPPPKMRGYELLAQKHCKDLGIPVIPVHKAIMTRLLDARKLADSLHPGNPNAKYLEQHAASRAACFYATPCGWGCSIKANFQSTTVLIPPAIMTGNLDVITDAMVHSVQVHKFGHANGVFYVDKETGKERFAKGRSVVLAASACESARILLNSKTSRHPDGVANSNGIVGRYLMDTVGASVRGQIPALERVPPHNEEGVGGGHAYIPWWLYTNQLGGKLDFARGYHFEFGSGRKMPSVGSFGALERLTQGAYGAKLKEEARRYYGSFIGFSGRGEMIPNENSFCEIDPDAKDKWGIPTLRFHWKWSEHELNQALHMQQTGAAIIEKMGGKVISKLATKGEDAILKPGQIIHEVGATRMGANASDSVLNRHSQTWEVPNLFVADGGAFPSSPDKNCTLTIMALAWRCADYLQSQLKRLDI